MIWMERTAGHVSRCGVTGRRVRTVCIVLAFAVAIARVFSIVGLASGSPVFPQGRAYEMVSPPYKAGQSATATTFVAAPDGESVAFYSIGVFAESPAGLEAANGYVAHRGAGGWVTSPADVPAVLSPITELLQPLDYSSDAAMSVSLVRFAPSGTITRIPSSEAFYLREPDGTFIEASPRIHALNSDEPAPGLGYDSGSADLSHLIFGTKARLLPSDTTDVSSSPSRLYEVDRAGGAPPSLRLVGVGNGGGVIDPYCPVMLGAEGVSAFHAVSRDGSQVVFTTNVEPKEETRCDEPAKPGESNAANPAEIFVRLNGSETLEVSKPLSELCDEVPCPGAKARATATFQGASEDGSKIFLTTTQPLVNADKDSTKDIYEAELGCKPEVVVCKPGFKEVTKLVLVSEGDSTDAKRGNGALVQGVVRISADGSHVYFVAKGVLTTSQNGLGQSAVAGAENLYVYDTSTLKTKFVAELCSGHKESGSQGGVEQCPGSESDEALWGVTDSHAAQDTSDGRFLVFDTYAQLIRTGPEADTNTAADVYRYDSLTRDIVRVSIGSDGYGSIDNSFDALIATPSFFQTGLVFQQELNSRAVTDDGSSVVFETSERLSPGAINGQRDIYEWHEGEIHLISGGQSPTSDVNPVITSSGRDVFFGTDQGLVAQDIDGAGDIYDARMGGGFPRELAPPACSGTGCQGVPPTPPVFATPSSVTFNGVGNFAVPSRLAVKRKTVKSKKVKKKHKAKKSGRAKGKKAAKSAKGRK